MLDKNSFRSPLTVRIYSTSMDQIDPAYSLPFGDKYAAHFEHCGALITDNAYQVTSEEAGIIPLDMIVGSRCLMEAKSLQPSCGGNQSYGPNKLQLDTEGVTIRDSEFNFNTGNTCSVIERSWPS